MSFSEGSLLKKFQELNNTQQSVQTLSLWLIHHRKHSEKIVKTWLKELINSNKCERKLTFIYLANDILQNSRKKGYEYLKEFANVLPESIENTAKYADTKIRFTLERILNIWKDRKICDDEMIDQLKSILHSTPSLTISPESQSKSNEITEAASKTNSKLDSDRKRKITDEKTNESNSGSSSTEPLSKLTNISKISLKDEVVKELTQNPGLISPEPHDLIQMLQELEKSASSDANVREKIAELPTRVTDANSLKNLKDRNEASELLALVSEAQNLTDNYNSRLQQELTSRKQTSLLLATFIKQQNQEVENETKLLEEWQRRLKQVKNVQHELQIHLESLPDLSSIEEAAILKPLPSAGDLFS